jgi:acetoin utilization deacetylase AcuC-like enzyme
MFYYKIKCLLLVSCRNGAQGFCYVNDIAVAISELLKSFQRVLYVDLDVHHGNGVENLFSEDSRVMTLSLHLSEPGFFPCTGNVDDVGEGEGKFYSVNVPLKAGLSNKSLISIFDK